MRILQTHAPAIFLVIIFILLRFRPSRLIRYVCVFVLIHFQKRFQIDESAQHISVDVRPKRIEMYAISNRRKRVSMQLGLNSHKWLSVGSIVLCNFV